MTAFPDASSVAGSADKLNDPGGSAYTASDKDGYLLFDNDLTSDGRTANTTNYLTRATAAFCYQTTAGGTITQFDEDGDQCNPVRSANCG
jgi:hypothetical protein